MRQLNGVVAFKDTRIHDCWCFVIYASTTTYLMSHCIYDGRRGILYPSDEQSLWQEAATQNPIGRKPMCSADVQGRKGGTLSDLSLPINVETMSKVSSIRW